jgi:hypothetical protein
VSGNAYEISESEIDYTMRRSLALLIDYADKAKNPSLGQARKVIDSASTRN